MDFISYNGALAGWGAEGVQRPEELVGAGFAYRKMHTLGHKVLRIDDHLDLAEQACRAMYGCGSGLTAAGLGREVAALLSRNLYPKGSVEVILLLTPPQEGGDAAGRLLAATRQLLYDGYAMWHDTLLAVTVTYDVPLPAWQTGASLAAHSCMLDIAGCKGADAVISLNRDGIVTGAGEWPLFAVAGGEVFTSPIGSGFPDSVERRLGIEACLKAGLSVMEEPMEVERIRICDELFLVDIQGIKSIGALDGRLFSHTAARRVDVSMR